MEIHPDKSKVLHIGKENPGLPYTMNGSEIPTVTLQKDIGFWISEDLSSATHVLKAWKGTGADYPNSPKLLLY